MKSAYKNTGSRLRILVMGYIVRGPIGGMTWHHIQYVIGLKALGHEVDYYEDSGDSEYCCYNPKTGITNSNPSYGLSYLKDLFAKLKLEINWAYYDWHSKKWYGNQTKFFNKYGDYDLLINLSASNPIRDWMLKIPVRVMIDTDPVFTQVRNLKDPARRALTSSHTDFFTFGENINSAKCLIPADGFDWLPTRQPISLELWANENLHQHERFTNVMQWESYPLLEYDGERYGTKAESFFDYLDLPSRTHQIMEIALGSSSAPRKILRENKWVLINPLKISKDPWTYQQYIQNSRAEFSIAKEAYVKSYSGWFSERSACYLASGRPVVTQETGFSSWLETGRGLLSFSSPEEAHQAIEEINGNYTLHSKKAREIIYESFKDQTVLNTLLERSMNKRYQGNTYEQPERVLVNNHKAEKSIKRLKIAFFDYPDVFEDFYPHYGVSQLAFATTWNNTANHQWLRIIQKEIGDVVWYVNCIQQKHTESIHKVIGCTIKYVTSSLFHRMLWKLFYLPSFSWRWRSYYRLYAVWASYLAPFSWQMWRTLKNDKPDVIYVQDYCTGRYDVLLFFAFLLKIPLITFHSGSTPDKYLGKSLRKLTLKKADWVFPSGENEQRILTQKFGVRKEHTSIIRPPINTEIYKPLDRKYACEETGVDPNRKYILFVGRLQESVKRLSAIIKIFSELAHHHSNVDLIIIGSGSDEASLRHEAKELAPGRIHFKGWISDDLKKASYYNVSELLVLNSWREASPAVIGEAFSCGIPVISSNVGGIDDLVIQNKSGWLFPAGNDILFKNYLSEALENPEKIKNMKMDIRRMALEKVSEKVIAKSLKKGFLSALSHDK